MSEQVAVACPKCGGNGMWDNRLSKRNPKAPDFKCKDKACDGVYWKASDVPQAAPAPAARPAARTPQPTNIGGPMPFDQTETGAAPTARAVVAGDEFALYSRCLDRALQEAIRVGLDKLGGDIAGAVVASAATLYIQANRR